MNDTLKINGYKEGLFEHVKQRALERHGVKYNKQIEKQMIKDIQTKRARFLNKKDKESWWLCHLNGQWYPVAYTTIYNTILTFLPKQAWIDRKIEQINPKQRVPPKGKPATQKDLEQLKQRFR